MRVHEYAKQLNLSSKEVLQFLDDNNLSVKKSHVSVRRRCYIDVR